MEHIFKNNSIKCFLNFYEMTGRTNFYFYSNTFDLYSTIIILIML